MSYMGLTALSSAMSSHKPVPRIILFVTGLSHHLNHHMMVLLLENYSLIFVLLMVLMVLLKKEKLIKEAFTGRWHFVINIIVKKLVIAKMDFDSIIKAHVLRVLKELSLSLSIILECQLRALRAYFNSTCLY